MARSARLPHLPRLAAGAVAGLAVALAGCSPITTADPYAASDGIRVELGDQVRGQNLMILTHAEGEAGILLGGLVNDGPVDTDVTMTIGSETVRLPIAAGQTLLLSAPNATPSSTLGVEEVPLASVPGAPGSFIDVRIETPEAGSVTVGVPVLDGTLESYEPVTPGTPSVVEEPDSAEPTQDAGAEAGH